MSKNNKDIDEFFKKYNAANKPDDEDPNKTRDRAKSVLEQYYNKNFYKKNKPFYKKRSFYIAAGIAASLIIAIFGFDQNDPANLTENYIVYRTIDLDSNKSFNADEESDKNTQNSFALVKQYLDNNNIKYDFIGDGYIVYLPEQNKQIVIHIDQMFQAISIRTSQEDLQDKEIENFINEFEKEIYKMNF